MKKIPFFLLIVLLLLVSACQTSKKNTMTTTSTTQLTQIEKMDDIPLNFTDIEQSGAYYQIFVRSFADSDGNGVGDFRGIAENINYLKELGVKGIWLMPMLESASYHGYDVLDYYQVEKDYGTKEDFIYLLNTAKANGIKVIIDLVVNHTSDQHEWFRNSKTDRNGLYGDYYVWIDSTDPRRPLKGSWNQNIWHAYSGKYYAGYFSNSMPDLNMMNEEVQNNIIEIGDYWLDLGVDGFRLDAAMHMFGKNEYPTSVDYRFENVYFWYRFRTELQKEHPDLYLVGEVWDTTGVIAPYFKGLHSAFNFEISKKILDTVKNNRSSGYSSSINYIYTSYSKNNPNFIDAPFLTNHDEDRVASVLQGDDLKMAADMLMMLPGNPFIYYGEELGMKGVKGGEGVWDITRRLPFIWSKTSDSRNTRWYISNVNSDVASVSEQLLNSDSLLNHYKNLIQTRNENIALSKGAFKNYLVNTANLISFIRTYEEGNTKQTVLVIHNTSTNDIPLNLNNEDFSKIIYKSNEENFASMIKANSTIVFEIKQSEVNNYLGS